MRSDYGDPGVSMKLDVGPPCWLTPELRHFVPTPTQGRYSFELPALPVMRLEEVLAEKIARLSRISTARDASDLVWAATTPPHSQFDRALVRRLATLKVWVDVNGLAGVWRPAISAQPFDAAGWLAARQDWDDEQIGLLAHPPPSTAELDDARRRLYGWLTELADDEADFAQGDSRHRTAVLRALRELPGFHPTCELY